MYIIDISYIYSILYSICNNMLPLYNIFGSLEGKAPQRF